MGHSVRVPWEKYSVENSFIGAEWSIAIFRLPSPIVIDIFHDGSQIRYYFVLGLISLATTVNIAIPTRQSTIIYANLCSPACLGN